MASTNHILYNTAPPKPSGAKLEPHPQSFKPHETKQVQNWGEANKHRTKKKKRKLKHNVKARIDLARKPQPPTPRELLRAALVDLGHARGRVKYFQDIQLRPQTYLQPALERLTKAQADVAKIQADIANAAEQETKFAKEVVEWYNKVKLLEEACKAKNQPEAVQRRETRKKAKLVAKKSVAPARLASLRAQAQKLVAQFSPEELQEMGIDTSFLESPPQA